MTQNTNVNKAYVPKWPCDNAMGVSDFDETTQTTLSCPQFLCTHQKTMPLPLLAVKPSRANHVRRRFSFSSLAWRTKCFQARLYLPHENNQYHSPQLQP